MTKKTLRDRTRQAVFIILFFLAAFILGVNLVIPLFLLALYGYLKFSQPYRKKPRLLYLIFLFVINFASTYFIIKERLPINYAPFLITSMLATILFDDLEPPLIITLSSSITAVSLGRNFYLGVLFLIGGIISSIFVLGARKRVVIIRAGALAGFAQALVLFFIDGLTRSNLTRYAVVMLNGIASGIIVIGVLPVFEYLFKTMTNISLLELADFNHPLLQRMMQEAPGTYHHSLVVGNLCEAASREIGANGLLSRIGAYYHDIGKLEKAQYFSENQDLNISKHDTLSPTMSKLIIMNHVKEGVELARKYKLNPCLTDFILQHHGKSLVYYFYRRALENLEEDEEVKEEGFRYPGPKPNTKETAIVLLADSVEAAGRTMKDPSPAKIEEVVHKIINNKFIDGQLDECELTLKDLEKIANVFIRLLSAIYHTRTTYPEGFIRNGLDHNHKKPAKEALSRSEKDKTGSH